MVHAKNYETVSTFGKVMQRKLLASFFRTRCIILIIIWQITDNIVCRHPFHHYAAPLRGGIKTKQMPCKRALAYIII